MKKLFVVSLAILAVMAVLFVSCDNKVKIEQPTSSVTPIEPKTKVGGVLSGEKLHWTKDMSPYLVIANILVEQGNELVIDPGVVVQLAGSFYIQVDGNLVAKGTQAERIRFYGIGDGAGEIKTANNGSATISYCDISAAATGSVTIENSTIEGNVNAKNISNSTIEGDVKAKNICDSTVAGDSRFNNSTVRNVDFNGKVNSSGSEFSYCSFNGSITSSKDDFEYCEFESCAFGGWDDSTVCWSNIVGCGTLKVSSNRSVREKLYCSGNFWGYDKTREMEESSDGNYGFIHDFHDDFNLSQICVHNYQEEPLAGIGYMGEGYEHINVPDHYKIGDIGPAGGMVFYVDLGDRYPGWDYLETSTGPDGIGNYPFGLYYADDSCKKVGTETGVGAGKRNTEKLVAAMGDTAWDFNGRNVSEYAAKKCSDYSVTKSGLVYDDWFLPSMDELNLVYQNLQKPGCVQFSSSYYWSSSEYSYYWAWEQHFEDGSQNIGGRHNYDFYVRPVRAF